MVENAQQRRQEAHRRNLRAKGLKQVSVWISDGHCDRIDELVKAGAFKNRSELMEAALAVYFERTAMT